MDKYLYSAQIVLKLDRMLTLDGCWVIAQFSRFDSANGMFFAKF